MIRNERKYLPLIQQTINLSLDLNTFSINQTPQTEISNLISKRIVTLTDSYLEMVDVFNFIDFADIAFLFRLNEYDFYPIRIFEKIEELHDVEDVLNLLNQIFSEMFGYKPNMNKKNDNYSCFINVYKEN
jgi:hypothetical protein